MSSKLRKLKSSGVSARLKESKSFAADQAGIWNEVHSLFLHSPVKSPTAALHDIFKAKAQELGSYLEESTQRRKVL